MMNDSDHREIARDLMVNATDVEFLDIVETVDLEHSSDDIEGDAQAIYKLINTARVTITWDDE